MYNNANAEQLMEKWAPVLEHGDGIQDAHKRAVTAQLLENQESAIAEERAFLEPDASGEPQVVAGEPGRKFSPAGHTRALLFIRQGRVQVERVALGLELNVGRGEAVPLTLYLESVAAQRPLDLPDFNLLTVEEYLAG